MICITWKLEYSILYLSYNQKKQKGIGMKAQIMKDLASTTFFANFMVTFMGVTLYLLNTLS